MSRPVPMGTLISTYASRKSLKLVLLPVPLAPGELRTGASSPNNNEALKPASHLSVATGALAIVSLNLFIEKELSCVFQRYESFWPPAGRWVLKKYEACTN